MAELKLKTVTRTQGNNRALKDGTVKPRTFAFEFIEVDPRKIGKRIYGIPVRGAADAAAPPAGVALGAVAGAAARLKLRTLAGEQGRVEGVDFVAVA